ncbi:MAG: glycosyltransferase family 1 protein [Acidithiobacillus ferrooxidans]|nr:glycosyltransferase family 1 protein [Acidithiobacillus ferrooxidans]MDD5003124.1 glycosyltransferase family 1 protein [Acidithiobacillus sp.]MDD5377612.1 glycosyltransferase family 1 protein [Acidithiobacillus sp.]MDD5575773.1 glycosyltransferase family 1 protein [Acidithiobacillus sp.]
MNTAIKRRIRSLLANSKIIAIVRNILRPFPALEEEARVWVYLFKKHTFRASHAPLLAESHRAPPNVIPEKHQLLVDISGLILRDVHTGVHRVVRSLLQELLRHPPTGYAVEAVYVDVTGQLRYARKFVNSVMGKPQLDLEEPPVPIHSGDVFFCPDLLLDYPFATLSAMQKNGLRIVFTLYDIIGLNSARLFPRAYELAFTDWFTGVMSVADAIVCDSRAVAGEVKAWLEDHPGQRARPLPIGYFHLGADIESSQPTQGPEGEGAEVLAACQSHPTLLMVGTLEPRKGHAQALAAVEALWQAGVDLNLVIIGKEGWRTQQLARQLRRHPERNRRLFWLEGASDALLMQLYAQSTALLAASYAEGFGLPLIEAARQGLPIIARDIPVFHEVAGEFAFYFPNTDSAALADSLRLWLSLYAEGKAPQSKDMPYLTWAQSTQQLLKVILENDWYTTYQPADARESTGAE